MPGIANATDLCHLQSRKNQKKAVTALRWVGSVTSIPNAKALMLIELVRMARLDRTRPVNAVYRRISACDNVSHSHSGWNSLCFV
jgi:hypothetical protein